ncbi:hypothetical protein [Halococcus thailandensis]|uniref:Uncharacterized protein n=1 Tax=Halococcus thailandensis JCM 13552 TaxID=1227457 RepID=M0NB10_9EURY|nr:hypothetical protein [Halococcus thailandensis]EMA53850.1 hypothetical protein C451_08725 [Halococcus thailandensis JCM 13552]
MSKSSSPRQLVTKVDPFNPNEVALFRDHEAVRFLQVKYGDSHWLLDNPIDDLVGPNQQLILVDWEDGTKLKHRDPDDVVQRCLELEPYIDYVWLGDRWTYEDKMTPRENRKQINTSIELQRFYGEYFEEYSVDFEYNPMLLGWKPWHLRRFDNLLNDFGGTLVGFDATGYRSKSRLRKDLNIALSTLDIQGIYVNGRIGPTHLAYLPNEVRAFSGKNQIIKKVRLGPCEYSRDLLTDEIEKRIRAFESPQAELGEFGSATS